jgi:hypothetical protein
MPRRFPPPWTVHEADRSWRVQDATGFAIVWFCWGERQGMDTAGERMTRAEAYAMAVNFARLPEVRNTCGADGLDARRESGVV